MFTISHIITTEMGTVKIFAKKKSKVEVKTELELITEEKRRLDKFEDFAIVLPIIVTALGIIVMRILYKIFMY